MERLGLVTARGGSKTIPLKNIKALGGKPLLAYPIGAMRRSGVVDRIVVSTDDERIAEVARALGAEVPFLRPAELAQDDTPSIPVVEHALAWLADSDGWEPNYVLLVQPTEPFVQPGQIRAAFELMLERGADSAITMVEVPQRNHPFHVRVQTDEGYLEFEQPEAHYEHHRRQLDPPRYAFANLFWFRRDAFLAQRQIEVGRRAGLLVDPLFAFDLNTEEDWRLAEAALAHGLIPDGTPDDPPR